MPGLEGEKRWVLTDGDERLGEWQQGSGLEHWSGECRYSRSMVLRADSAHSYAPRNERRDVGVVLTPQILKSDTIVMKAGYNNVHFGNVCKNTWSL